MQAKQIPLQLLRGTSDQGADPRTYLYIFLDDTRIEVSLEISTQDFLICLCNGGKGFTFVNSPYL